jgi:LPS sulfotransferase NodH
MGVRRPLGHRRPVGRRLQLRWLLAGGGRGREHGQRIFAARIKRGKMDEVMAHLAPVYSGRDRSDSGLLTAAFGRTCFVYLRRGDVVAQAVSLLRAEQTGVWFETADKRQEPEREPGFDFSQVRERVRQIEEHDAAWQEWFAAEGVQPYPVLYEELDADPVRVASGVLGFLGLNLPAGREIIEAPRGRA